MGHALRSMGVVVRVAVWLFVTLALLSLAVSLLTISKVAAGAFHSEKALVVPDDYNSIQAAIDDAPEGSTIMVRPGLYVEQVTVSKRLTLAGSGNSTIIKSVGGSATVEIPRGVNGVVFEGFLINGTGGASVGINVRSQNNILINNTVAGHSDIGVCIYDSSGDYLRGNKMMNNTRNLKVWGLSLEHFLHDIDSSNLVEGRPVCYWVNQSNQVIPSNVGYVAIVNSTNITVKDLNLTSNYSGVLLAYTSNSLVSDVTCTKNVEGVRLVLSNDNTIVNNTLAVNDWIGISFVASSGNNIAGNNVSLSHNGIYFSYSSLLSPRSNYNTVRWNDLYQNGIGFYLDNASFNYVYSNKLSNNTVAANFDLSDHNIVVGNWFINNKQCGIKIDNSGENVLYHNNFLNNAAQVSVVDHSPNPPPLNSWDNGYPDGGNYWDDYDGSDVYSGAGQNVTGGDGIGDAPYVVGADNSDRFPLMGLFYMLNAGTWDGLSYSVCVASNYTVMNLIFDPRPVGPFFNFSIVAETGASGFCRVIIPKNLLSTDAGWKVTAGLDVLNYSSFSDSNSTYIYFIYSGSSRTIFIEGTHALPEFPSFLLSLLLAMFVTASVLLVRKGRIRHCEV